MLSDMPVIALTGATGFVGRKLLPDLLGRGYRVKALIRPTSFKKAPKHDGLTWVQGELGDTESEKRLVQGADILIHMAGLITARTKSQYEQTNSIAVGSLAAQSTQAGVGKFVYLSSLAAKAPELSWYAWSKHQGELSLKHSYPEESAVIVRAPAVFGAGDKATAPIYSAIGRGFLPAPGGRNWRNRQLSLVHVDDLADFLCELCERDDWNGKTISPSTRARISWPQFAEACQDAVGSRVRVLPIPTTVLYTVAALTTLVKGITGRGHLTLGKLGEFLYEDWSVEDDLQSGASLQTALKKTIEP